MIQMEGERMALRMALLSIFRGKHTLNFCFVFIIELKWKVFALYCFSFVLNRIVWGGFFYNCIFCRIVQPKRGLEEVDLIRLEWPQT